MKIYDKLDWGHIAFIGIILILTTCLLFIGYAANKDMVSLRKAYTECEYNVAQAKNGMLPLLYDKKWIEGDLNVTDTKNS